MSIEGIMELEKYSINFIVIVMINCCLFKDKQSLLFIYRDICT